MQLPGCTRTHANHLFERWDSCVRGWEIAIIERICRLLMAAIGHDTGCGFIARSQQTLGTNENYRAVGSR